MTFHPSLWPSHLTCKQLMDGCKITRCLFSTVLCWEIACLPRPLLRKAYLWSTSSQLAWKQSLAALVLFMSFIGSTWALHGLRNSQVWKRLSQASYMIMPTWSCDFHIWWCYSHQLCNGNIIHPGMVCSSYNFQSTSFNCLGVIFFQSPVKIGLLLPLCHHSSRRFLCQPLLQSLMAAVSTYLAWYFRRAFTVYSGGRLGPTVCAFCLGFLTVLWEEQPLEVTN